MGAVVVFHLIVDTFGGQFGMQLTIVTVLVLTLVVIDTVGAIRGLLDFCQEASGTYGVDAACGQEEAIAFLYLILCQGIADGVVIHHFLVLIGSNLFFQSAIEFCARF